MAQRCGCRSIDGTSLRSDARPAAASLGHPCGRSGHYRCFILIGRFWGLFAPGSGCIQKANPYNVAARPRPCTVNRSVKTDKTTRNPAGKHRNPYNVSRPPPPCTGSLSGLTQNTQTLSPATQHTRGCAEVVDAVTGRARAATDHRCGAQPKKPKRRPGARLKSGTGSRVRQLGDGVLKLSGKAPRERGVDRNAWAHRR